MRNLHRLRALVASPITMMAVAFGVRMGMMWHELGPAPPRNFYFLGSEIGRIAGAIASGHGYSSPFIEPTGPTAWVAPVYPYLLAAVYKVFGLYTYTAYLSILTLNSVFAALTCLPICGIARRVFNDRVAVWSGWLWCLFPPFIEFPIRWVWETSLSALLVGVALWMTLRLQTSARLRDWCGFGLLCGVCALTNPALLAPLPFLGAWALFRLHKKERSALRLAAAGTLVFLLSVTPWLVRNYVVFHQPVFFRSNAGLELYLGNNPEVADSWAWWLHPSDSAEEMEKFRRMGEMAYVAQKQRAALQFMKSHPGTAVRLALNRFVFFWTGSTDSIPDVLEAGYLLTTLKILSYTLLGMLGMVGLFAMSRRSRAGTFPFAMVLIFYPLVYYVTHPIQRFRHPLDPLLVILAVSAIASIFVKPAANRAR